MSKSRLCPCTSGKSYKECCAPYHEGVRQPEDAPTLVRARYAAFAFGQVDFLWNTLHEHHPDRARGRERTRMALRVASASFKYMGLIFIDARDADADGVSQILYLARIFQKGHEVSFVELADFAPDDRGIAYLAGRSVDLAKLAGDPAALTIETFPRE